MLYNEHTLRRRGGMDGRAKGVARSSFVDPPNTVKKGN